MCVGRGGCHRGHCCRPRTQCSASHAQASRQVSRGRLYVFAWPLFAGAALAVDIARDPARTPRRPLDTCGAVGGARGRFARGVRDPALRTETSTSFRLMRWLVRQSPDAATGWGRLESALGDGAPLVEGRPDGRTEIVFCPSCNAVKNPHRVRRALLPGVRDETRRRCGPLSRRDCSM
jgi:hypothetical protein